MLDELVRRHGCKLLLNFLPTARDVSRKRGHRPYEKLQVRGYVCAFPVFESNFPVDKQGCSYTVLFNAFQRICDQAGYTAAERADLFAGTARRFYRVEPPALPLGWAG